MTLINPHPEIDSCTTKRQEFIPQVIDKCLDKPLACKTLAEVCVAGLLLLGGYGEFVSTDTCQSKLLLTETSFPPSCITVCESKLVCEYTSFENSEFQADP